MAALAAAEAHRLEGSTSDTVTNDRDVLDEIGRVHRLYAVLSRVNEAIIRVRSQQDLLEAACRIAVEDGGFALAWIGFVVPETQRIRVHAKYGRDDGYLDDIEISLRDDVPEGRGPTGVAMREGRPFINNDTATDPTVAPWREEQLKRGYRSSASFPLKIAGATIGVITLYCGTAHYFDEEEVHLLSVLADDFSFALEAAEVARERAAAEEALRSERGRLARDLHDSVTQALFAVSLKAESLTEGCEAELTPGGRRGRPRGAPPQPRRARTDAHPAPRAARRRARGSAHLAARELRRRGHGGQDEHRPAPGHRRRCAPARRPARGRLPHHAGGPQQCRAPRQGEERAGRARALFGARTARCDGRRPRLRARRPGADAPGPAVDARARRRG